MARRILFGAVVAAIALALAGPAGACSTASLLVNGIKGGPGGLKAYPGSTVTVTAEGLNPTHGSLNLIMEGAVVATSAMQVAYEAGSKVGSAVFTFTMQAEPRPEPYLFTVAAANGSQDAGLGSLRTAVTVTSAPAPQPAPQPTPTEPGGSNGGGSPQPQPPAVAPPPAPSVSTPTPVATPTSTPATQATPTVERPARAKKAAARRATPAPAVVPNPAVGEDVPAESGIAVEAPVASPVPADEEGLAWWILALAALGIFLLGTAAGGLAVRRRRGTEPTDLPPLAVDLDAELEKLLTEGETQAPEPAEKR